MLHCCSSDPNMTLPQVTTPILKLFAELVQNRSQRLQFDVSSPNGILLFRLTKDPILKLNLFPREASNIICSYGNRILNVQVIFYSCCYRLVLPWNMFASIKQLKHLLCSGCEGPDVSTQAEGNLYLLLNAESCTLWLLCKLWGVQVVNQWIIQNGWRYMLSNAASEDFFIFGWTLVFLRVSGYQKAFWNFNEYEEKAVLQKLIRLSGCTGTKPWTMHSTLSSHSFYPFHRFLAMLVPSDDCYPQTDLLDYPKLSQTYYVLLECLAQDHMAFLATLEPQVRGKPSEWGYITLVHEVHQPLSLDQVFLYILASISEGLQALGGNLNYFTGAGDKLASVLNPF